MSAGIQADCALLRRFEPVLRYTRGEQFFPMSADTYVQNCSLWLQRPNKKPVFAHSPGQLTSALNRRTADFGAVYFQIYRNRSTLPPNWRPTPLQQGFAPCDPQEVSSRRAGPIGLSRLPLSRFLTRFSRSPCLRAGPGAG